MSTRFSILEQSQLPSGASGTDALRDSLQVAKAADSAGYERIWFSEHHNLPVLQGSVPELLVASAAQHTTSIRLGTGGIMVANHSPFHVAEVFRTLEALAPGRIDAGVGNAAGGFPAKYAIGRGSGMAATNEGAVEAILRLLEDRDPSAVATPQTRTTPPVWVLSGAGHARSGEFAAAHGLGYALAAFINPDVSIASVEHYRRTFVPSKELPQPSVILAVTCVCADTEEKLAELKKVSDYFRIRRDTGNYLTSIPSAAEMERITFSGQDQAYLKSISARQIVGLPDQVVAEARRRAQHVGADEVMFTFMTHDVADRIFAIESIAAAAAQAA